MKITSGKYKYRKLTVPDGIRPTTEKVREAVFSMAAPWIPGAAIFDMFAGSGAMGLEALSRGAAHCWFAESDRKNQKLLAENIRSCGAESESDLLAKGFRAAISDIAAKGAKLDVVIMDPPYEKTEYYETAMMLMQECGILNDGSIVICEHLYNNKLSETYGCLEVFRTKKYGSIGVDVFEYRP